MQRLPVLQFALSLLIAASALAQTPDHLVGLTRSTPRLLHHDHRNCGLISGCNVPLPGPLPQWAGGTAWDPVRRGTWVTDGTQLLEVDDGCGVLCPAMPLPGMGGNVFATGLEVVESQNRILVLDSLGRLHSLSNTCPPIPGASCDTGLVSSASVVTTGLAVDEGSGLAYVALVHRVTGDSYIATVPLATPCQFMCSRQLIVTCVQFGPVQGLACDWGRQVLYATDGVSTVAISYTPNTSCPQFGTIDCCTPNMPAGDPFVGLAVRPGRATSHGQPCNNGTCPQCPMAHRLVNDPNLGNAQFRLGLDLAPANSLAWCLIGAQPCSSPGLLVPPLCGPVFTQPLLGTLGPIPTGGAGGCTGSAVYPFPMPPWPSLAGWTLSSQCIALCSNGGALGTSVSNCLSWSLQGN